MRLVSLGAVYILGLYEIRKNEMNNIEINTRGLCQYVDRHKR